MLSKECSFYFAHESVHATMLYFFVLSQDTLFLPDDSFFSLYRVFGVTEVFNEVLGDYYIVICMSLFQGEPFWHFSIYKIASVPLLSKYFTVFANVAMSLQDSLLFGSRYSFQTILFCPYEVFGVSGF
jgi:hypothetical protein